jgi:hypothetical protein
MEQKKKIITLHLHDFVSKFNIHVNVKNTPFFAKNKGLGF